MADIKVKNRNNTSRAPSCGCGTWIDHWKNAKRGHGAGCKVSSPGAHTHQGSPRGGAHVIKVGDKDKKVYIVPMCPGHNNQKSDVELTVDSSTLVRAVKLSTCG